MKLVGVLGAGFFAVSLCCCGDPTELISKLKARLGGGEPAPEASATPATPAPVVQAEIKIGIPRNADVQPAPPGVFLRYTHLTLGVQEARQYHDGWLRKNGWQTQVDSTTATGWTLEAVQGEQRLTIEIEPLGEQGVNVVFKLL